MPPPSVKCMFPESGSSDSSSDSDEETTKNRRKGRQKIRKDPIRISFEPAETVGTSNEERGEEDSVEGEPGLFIIDSTGGGGNVGIKENDKDKWAEPSPLDPGVDLSQFLHVNLDCLRWRPKKTTTKYGGNVEVSKNMDLVNELMKKATFKPELEKNPTLPLVSRAELKRRRKAEREKTKGSDWFNMPATEQTEERKRDLEVMQLRDVFDPQRRYRSDDRSVLPKYFQIGTVIEHPADFYHSRVPRKERKQTIVDELLADAELQKRSKRKYAEIMQKKTRYHGGRMEQKKDKGKKKRKLKH